MTAQKKRAHRPRKEWFGEEYPKNVHGDIRALHDNPIALAAPPGSSHYDHLKEIAHNCSRPFAIKCLSERLKGIRFPKGRTYFGNVADSIDRIVGNYAGLQWRMEEDALVVVEATPNLDALSDFDRIAGALAFEHFVNRKLSTNVLELIATCLDKNGILLKKALQRAQWKPISEFNQKNSRAAVKTFGAALANPKWVRNVRKRLCLARNRYEKAARLDALSS